MLFLACGMSDLDEICDLIARTAIWDVSVIKEMLYVTQQHTRAVTSQAEALRMLSTYMQAKPCGHVMCPDAIRPNHSGNNNRNNGDVISQAEDLLHANVLPHLATPDICAHPCRVDACK